MDNIRLPIPNDLPVVEPATRPPRESDSARADSSFDDHLERAAQPSTKQAASQDDLGRDTSLDSDSKQEPSLASPSENSLSADENRQREDAGPTEGNEAKGEPEADTADDSRSEEEATESLDAHAKATDTDPDSEDLPPELPALEDKLQPVSGQESTADGATTKSKETFNEKEGTPTAKNSASESDVEKVTQQKQVITDEKSGPPVAGNSDPVEPASGKDNSLANESSTTDELEAKRAEETLVETDDVKAKRPTQESQTATPATGDEPKIKNPTTQDGQAVASERQTESNSSVSQPADAQTQDETNNPQEESPSREKPARSNHRAAAAESKNAEATTAPQPSGELASQAAAIASTTDVSAETIDLSPAASQAITSEGISEPATATTGSAELSSGQTNPLTRAASQIAAKQDSPITTEGNLSETQRARFVQRVAGAFRAAEERDGTVRVRLSPPELGSLRLQVTVRQGAMVAQLETETPEARRLILEHLPELRDRLAQQDMKVERFDVDLRDESPDHSPESSDSEGSLPEDPTTQGLDDSENAENEADTEVTDRTIVANETDQLNIVI